MYRIRFHGRGGQGMKTASRILGSAFFSVGFEVQDAPRYGAERRGAPIFAYVRAARDPINERGVITEPDLVIVADDSLVDIAAAGVTQGLSARTVLLINSREDAATWAHRLNLAGPVLVLPAAVGTVTQGDKPFAGVACAGAAAALVGVIARAELEAAVRTELASLPEQLVKQNVEIALHAYDQMQSQAGLVQEAPTRPVQDYEPPQWLEPVFEDARRSAPAIHAAATSVQVRTGLWRTLRPVIDYDRCNRCWWVCSTFCPDSCIQVSDDGVPEIDYDHCKGCMICVAKCPPHAIGTVLETDANAADSERESA
jgi:pyruvate ferredoxin oxidoreductase gamma subunit